MLGMNNTQSWSKGKQTVEGGQKPVRETRFREEAGPCEADGKVRPFHLKEGQARERARRLVIIL